MTQRQAGRCPECQKEAPREGNKSYPFCSSRCRDVDLGRWLREEYRVPTTPNERDLQELLDAAERPQGRE
jgi:endogenous inhibitor of DNA gyrase (YacG/DUF329 family)